MTVFKRIQFFCFYFGNVGLILLKVFFCNFENQAEYLRACPTIDINSLRSHNQGWKPQAWGSRVPMCCTKKFIFRKNCATLHVISPSGYTQICVGLLPYMENGRESPVQFRQNYIIFKYFECENNILLPCTSLTKFCKLSFYELTVLSNKRA